MAWRFALWRGEAAGVPLPGGAESSLAEAAIVQEVAAGRSLQRESADLAPSSTHSLGGV